MFLKADEKCYLTQAGTVDIKDRVFQQIAYLTKPEQAMEWRQVTDMERAQIIAQAQVLDTENLTPEYLQKVETLVAAIPAAINARGFTDEEALENKGWFPVWGDGNAYMGMPVEKGFMFRHKTVGKKRNTRCTNRLKSTRCRRSGFRGKGRNRCTRRYPCTRVQRKTPYPTSRTC